MKKFPLCVKFLNTAFTTFDVNFISLMRFEVVFLT